MKNLIINILLKTIAKGGIYMAIFSSNITCNGGGHQDILPTAVKKLRKF